MPFFESDGIRLAYEQRGPEGGPILLLLNGAGLQLIDWTPSFIDALTEAGIRITPADHRDAGLSTHLTGAPKARLTASARNGFEPPYTLWNMAADIAGLAAALGPSPVHLAGFSLGAAVAQAVAISHPERIASLTLIASSTGAPGVGRPTAEARRVIMRSLPADPDAALREAADRRQFLASPGESDGIGLPSRVAVSMARSWDPAATGRQLAAVRAAGDRTEALRRVRIPALVIHGVLDPAVDVSGGRALHDALPEARLVVYENMAHDVPSFLADRIAGEIAGLIASASS